MSKKDSKPSLNELMGKQDENKISLKNLHNLLGEKMPMLPKNKVGKMRLIHALQNRLGTNFRQFPGVNDTLAEFDKEIELHEIIGNHKG